MSAQLSFPELPPELRNGPEEIGLAAGVDTCNDADLAAVLYRSTNARDPPRVSPPHTLVSVFLSFSKEFLSLDDGLPAGLALLVYYAAASCKLCTLVDGENVKEMDPGITQDEVDRVSWFLEEACKKIDVSRAWLVLLSTKVLWFQTNHHVGQGSVQGFVRKCILFALGKPGDYQIDDNLRKYVWGAGHTISTRLTLHLLGVPGINVPQVDEMPRLPKITRDVSMRLTSGVAGCMKLMDAVAIFRRVATQPYRVAVNLDIPAMQMLESEEAILRAPAAHHVGARYLTGRDRESFYEPSDVVYEAASAIIHATAPKGTLAANRTLPAKESITSSELYVTISSMKRAMADPKRGKRLLERADAAAASGTKVQDFLIPITELRLRRGNASALQGPPLAALQAGSGPELTTELAIRRGMESEDHSDEGEEDESKSAGDEVPEGEEGKEGDEGKGTEP